MNSIEHQLLKIMFHCESREAGRGNLLARCRRACALGKSLFLSINVLIFFITGCGITQPIRPIEEGTTDVVASFGGPIIPFASAAIPVPYLTIGTLYGYSSNITLYGNAHLTALLFKDVGVDAGFSSSLLSEQGIRPEITVNGRAYFFWDAFRGNSTRLFPMGTLTASYAVNEHSLFYFGADNLFQLSSSDIFISPFAGYSFPIGESTVMQVESKWLAMNQNTRHGIFEGATSIAGRGNISLFFGLQYSLK